MLADIEVITIGEIRIAGSVCAGVHTGLALAHFHAVQIALGVKAVPLAHRVHTIESSDGLVRCLGPTATAGGAAGGLLDLNFIHAGVSGIVRNRQLKLIANLLGEVKFHGLLLTANSLVYGSALQNGCAGLIQQHHGGHILIINGVDRDVPLGLAQNQVVLALAVICAGQGWCGVVHSGRDGDGAALTQGIPVGADCTGSGIKAAIILRRRTDLDFYLSSLR